MKRVKILLATVSFGLATVAPVLLGSVAQAARVPLPLVCPTIVQDGEFTQVDNHVDSCDLSVDKQVSVNGGAFVEADTSGTAANAQLGDTVTWQVTVTNSSKLTPHGTVFVEDVLPSGVSFQSYVASDGTYTSNDGSFFENYWILPLLKSDGGSGTVTTLPATLTITTKATSLGLAQNTAVLKKYDTGSCDGGCVYGDADAGNDSNDAWARVQPKPQVLAANTGSVLAPTGNGSVANLAAGLLIIVALGLTTYWRTPKGRNHYKA